jgi:DNA topoisomerase IA
MELVGFKESFALLIHSYWRKVKKDKTYIRDLGALKQLNTIDQLFNNCDSIIVATDAGREGELIFRPSMNI